MMVGNKCLCLAVLIFCFCFFDVHAQGVVASRRCLGDTTYIALAPHTDSLVSIHWDLNNDGVFSEASGDSIKWLFNRSDTFYINVKTVDTAGRVTYLQTPFQVIVDPLPNASFTSQGLCVQHATTFNNHSSISSGTISYAWDFRGNGTVDSTTRNPVYTYATTGTYNPVLTVTSGQGCISKKRDTLVFSALPIAAFISVTACPGLPIKFVNASSATSMPFSSNWLFSDSTLNFDNDSTRHTYAVGGTYDVNLIIVDSKGCSDTVANAVTLPVNVTATAVFNPESTIRNGQKISVEITGVFDHFTWLDSITDNPRTVSDSGRYRYTVTNTAGCTLTDSVQIGYYEDPVTAIEAVKFITPNGDGKNDLLVFKHLEHYKVCKVKVYDQSGQQVYTSDDYHNDWDCKTRGTLVAAGAYYYSVQCDDQPQIKGSINILW